MEEMKDYKTNNDDERVVMQEKAFNQFLAFLLKRNPCRRNSVWQSTLPILRSMSLRLNKIIGISRKGCMQLVITSYILV
jgi:hypothetical protein